MEIEREADESLLWILSNFFLPNKQLQNSLAKAVPPSYF